MYVRDRYETGTSKAKNRPIRLCGAALKRVLKKNIPNGVPLVVAKTVPTIVHRKGAQYTKENEPI